MSYANDGSREHGESEGTEEGLRTYARGGLTKDLQDRPEGYSGGWVAVDQEKK